MTHSPRAQFSLAHSMRVFSRRTYVPKSTRNVLKLEQNKIFKNVTKLE